MNEWVKVASFSQPFEAHLARRRRPRDTALSDGLRRQTRDAEKCGARAVPRPPDVVGEHAEGHDVVRGGEDLRVGVGRQVSIRQPRSDVVQFYGAHNHGAKGQRPKAKGQGLRGKGRRATPLPRPTSHLILRRSPLTLAFSP